MRRLIAYTRSVGGFGLRLGLSFSLTQKDPLMVVTVIFLLLGLGLFLDALDARLHRWGGVDPAGLGPVLVSGSEAAAGPEVRFSGFVSVCDHKRSQIL